MTVSSFILGKIEGMSEMSVQSNKRRLVGRDGVDISDISYPGRMITISGIIDGRGSGERVYKLKRELALAANGKDRGRITYENDLGRWQTAALAEQLVFGERMGEIIPFVLHLCAYDFYWQGERLHSREIATLEKKLAFPLALPTMFGSKRSSTMIVNGGDIPTPPIIEIVGEVKNPKIVNESTGEMLMLECSLEEGERAIISCGDYTAVSDRRGNILHFVTPDSVFFCLPCGESIISCFNDDLDDESNVTLRWRELFLSV